MKKIRNYVSCITSKQCQEYRKASVSVQPLNKPICYRLSTDEVVANGGERIAPHLLKEVHKSSDNDKIGDIDFSFERKVLNKIDTSEEYLNRVKQGFIAVLNSPGGYGVGYMNTDMRPAGKTGTSQSFIDTNNDGRIDTETITSSFIGYAPYDNPKMSIVVTSPDSSHPNSSTDYASLVTYRITREVTAKYSEMYGID